MCLYKRIIERFRGQRIKMPKTPDKQTLMCDKCGYVLVYDVREIRTQAQQDVYKWSEAWWNNIKDWRGCMEDKCQKFLKEFKEEFNLK